MKDFQALADQVNNAVTDFKAGFNEKFDEISGRYDTLAEEITNLKTVATLGGPGASGNRPETAEEKQYRQAFAMYALKGPDALGGDIRNALSVGSNPDGGFWVPSTISQKIAQKLFETSPMRRIANIETIPTDELEKPVDNDECDAGWVGETETRDDTDTPEIGLHKIPLHEVYAQPKSTQKLLDMQGVVDFENWLVDKIVKKLSRVENAAFITGNGIMKPRGLTTYDTSAAADESRAWGTIQHIITGADGGFKAADASPADCMLDTVFSLKEPYLENACWIMARATMAVIAKLKDVDGKFLLGTARLQDKTPFELLGFPVHLFSDMPAYTTTGALAAAFGDFREGYTIVDHRKGVSILRDPFTSKPYVKFYTTKYTGGAVVNSEAIKFLKFSAS